MWMPSQGWCTASSARSSTPMTSHRYQRYCMDTKKWCLRTRATRARTRDLRPSPACCGTSPADGVRAAALKSGYLGELIDKAEHLKASVRGQGGAPVSRHQAAVWLRQDALQRPGQEHGEAGDDVCTEQFVDVAPSDTYSAGMRASAVDQRASMRQ